MAEPAATPAAPAARVETGYLGPRRKVLVIDDVPVNRAVVVEFLTRLGFETVEAATGREGLAKAQSEQPSLILTDIVMPEMDGLETTRRLRQLTGLAEVPVIAVSASSSGTNEKNSLAAGVDAFLSKPVDFDKLLAQIAALLALKWTYAPQAPSAAAGASQEPPLAVPASEMSELHRLARDGNMREIVLWAERVAALNPLYASFTAQLRLLAKGYQSKAILQLVEQHMEHKPAP